MRSITRYNIDSTVYKHRGENTCYRRLSQRRNDWTRLRAGRCYWLLCITIFRNCSAKSFSYLYIKFKILKKILCFNRIFEMWDFMKYCKQTLLSVLSSVLIMIVYYLLSVFVIKEIKQDIWHILLFISIVVSTLVLNFFLDTVFQISFRKAAL